MPASFEITEQALGAIPGANWIRLQPRPRSHMKWPVKLLLFLRLAAIPHLPRRRRRRACRRSGRAVSRPPDHPACQQILDAFADLRRPLRARDLCVALDLPVVAKNTENIRSKLKRLASRGILIETEPGLFAQPRP